MRLLMAEDGPVDYEGKHYRAQGRGAGALAVRRAAARDLAGGPRSADAAPDGGEGRRLDPHEDDARRLLRRAGRASTAPPRTSAATSTTSRPGCSPTSWSAPTRRPSSGCTERPADQDAVHPAAELRVRAARRRAAARRREGSGFHDFIPTRVPRCGVRPHRRGDPAQGRAPLRVLRHAGADRRGGRQVPRARAAPPDPAGTSPGSATPRWPSSASRRWSRSRTC